MKNFLKRIFSVALVAMIATSPSMAQMAERAIAKKNVERQALVSSKAQSTRQKSLFKLGKETHIQQPCPISKGSAKGLRTAKKSGMLKTKSIQKENTNVPELYGSVIYKNTWDGSQLGLYKFAPNSNSSELVIIGPDASAGGICVGDIYWCTTYYSFWGMYFITVDAFNVETEEIVGEWSSDDPSVIGVGGYSMDETTNTAYGITLNANGDGLQLSTLSFDLEEGISTTAVSALSGNFNSMAFDASGQLYAIMYDGYQDEEENFIVDSSKLVKIDKTTGAITEVGETGVAPQYISSCVIDGKTNRMFWNVVDIDTQSFMYEVNLSTGEATLLYEYPESDEIMGMYIPKAIAEDNAPAVCENVEVILNNNSLTGAISLITPSSFFDGKPGSGSLTIKVMANNEEVGSSSTSWGSQESVTFTVGEAGMYDFLIYAENENGAGPKTKLKNVWLGSDTPAATTATLVYQNGNMEVSWEEVTSSVNGGYVDYANMTYKVIRNDGTVVAEGLTVTSFSEPMAEAEELTEIYYNVYAVDGVLVSAPARTNSVVFGSIIPPYTSDYSSSAGLAGWTIIDANDDSKSWNVYNGEVRVQYNSIKDMDDWLITPPVSLEAGKVYNLTFKAHTHLNTYSERLEVLMGDSPTVEGMTVTVLEPTDILTKEATEFNVMLVPETTGKYYVGFHGISDKNKYFLYLGNITIESGISAFAPGLATDLVVTPDAAGALKANISFTSPSTTLHNQPLSSLTKVEVLRNNVVIKTFENPGIGASISYEDILSEGGNVEYAVIGYNEEGEGLKATASAFIGFDKPLNIAFVNIERTPTVGEVLLTWDPVTEDINGMPLTANDVTYAVCEYVDGTGWVIKADGIAGCSYTFQAVETGSQDLIQRGVAAFTTGGNSAITVSDLIPVGTPYNGLNASFPNGTLGQYVWGFTSIDGGSVVLMTDNSGVPAQDGDNGMIAVQGEYLDAGACLFSGLVSLENMENPGLSFYTFDITNIVEDSSSAQPDINEIAVSVRTSDQMDYTEVYSGVVSDICAGTDGWGKVTIPLGDYANQVIQFQITGITKEYQFTILDNIKVGSILAHDLKAGKITAPERVKTGMEYTVGVTVVNEGFDAASGYTVELYSDDMLVESKTGEALYSGMSETVSFNRNMSGIATDPVSYYAKVVYAADENDYNNQTSTVTVTPLPSTLPAPVDLEGTYSNGAVTLTWNEPDLDSENPTPITEDFEDADAFSNEYGDWTFIDADQSPVGGFQNMYIPGITPGSTTGSFWIWDHSQLGNQTFEAHSGNNYLFSLFRNDEGTSDEWAISPLLCGDAQTVSFYAKSYSDEYPEKIRVCYSSSDSTDTDDYVEALVVDVVPKAWTYYEVEVPAGTLHFAINSCATGAFMLMIDDVTYTPALPYADLSIEGYNVYRNGVKINDTPIGESEFVDNNVEPDKEYTYVVTVVYTDRGESALSNECVIKTVGVKGVDEKDGIIVVDGRNIVILNADCKPVNVSEINGSGIFNGQCSNKTVIPVSPGVYIVKLENRVKKIFVK